MARRSERIAAFPSYLAGSFRQTLAGLRRRRHFIPARPGAETVILVPGACCTGSEMNRLGAALEVRGFAVLVPPTFPYYLSAVANTCRLEQAARLFMGWLETIRIPEVRVIGHSNGGLIPLLTREMLDKGQVSCSVTIRGVVTMASPLLGFPDAGVLKTLLPCCHDIVPGCETLKRIGHAREAILGSLVASSDFLIPPENQYLHAGRISVMEGFQHMDFIVGGDDKIERSATEAARWLRNSG